MKKIILTIIVLLTVISCRAQLNNINNDEFGKSIKFNNISLGDIMIASGDLTIMRSYFGNSIQETSNNTGLYIGKELSNSNIVMGFEDETDTGNNYDLTDVVVLNSNVIVNVKGLSIRIGDDKSKFGNYLFNSTDSSYNFTDADTGSVGLSFKINNSNKVSEIELICF